MRRTSDGRDPGLMSFNGTLNTVWLKVRDSYFWMVMIAFGVRFAYVLIAHTYKFKTAEDNFGFGFEMGRIGRSLAQGQGFSNPFHGVTGPTAWEPPLYPFLIAGVFKVFGIYTKASAVILLSINSVFAASTCVPIFLIANRCFDKNVARWTSWLWAVLPPIMFWSTRWIWETSLATLLLTVIFWLTLVMEEKQGVPPWIQFGFLWGIAALTNTSLLAFLPASALWMWYRGVPRRKDFLMHNAAASLVFVIFVAPWIARNYITFGHFIFIRSDFGAELRLGNGPGADGTWMEDLHPSKNAHELRRYTEMGETAYVAERKRQAVAFITHDYPRFAILCAKRFTYYWEGVPRRHLSGNLVFAASSLLAFWGLGRALRRRRPGAWLFFWLVVCYPLMFYFVFPLARYRHPIEPELGVLIIYLICEAMKQVRGTHSLQLASRT